MLERKIKTNFTLEQATEGQEGGTGIDVLFINLNARWGWVVKTTFCPLYLRERETLPLVREAGWVPAADWTGAENLIPTGTAVACLLL